MAEELLAYWVGETANYKDILDRDAPIQGEGQVFYLDSGLVRKLTRIEFKLSKQDIIGPPGACVIEVFLIDEQGVPIGDAIATASLDGSELTETPTWYSKTLSPQPTLTGAGTNTKWAACIRSTGAEWPLFAHIRWSAAPAIEAEGKVNLGGNVEYYNEAWQGKSGGTLITNIKIYGEPLLPGIPTNPSPTDIATGITLDEAQLSWDASDPAADTYNVYFGEEGSMVSVSNVQAGVTWAISFSTLKYGVVYKWRVDATNAAGTITGNIWTFTALVFLEPGSGSSPGSGSGIGAGAWVRRLVAVAANKFYYENI